MIITKKKIIKRALLPGYIPRIKQLFGSGFDTVVYLIAIAYNLVRILPDTHPYVNSKNFGQYSILDVFREAKKNIVFKKENIDQIIIYFTVMIAIIILFIQLLLLALIFVTSKAFAGSIPDDIRDFFIIPDPDNDVAIRLLNLVFGVPDFFGGTFDQTTIHQALHGLFQFYSIGILIVACFIIIYLAAATVAETAESGVPFGKRFNHAWAPVRLIVFFALLLPSTHGINPAQYITLLSARLATGLASTGWNLYNETVESVSETITGLRAENVAVPEKTDMMYLPAYMSIVRTCAYAYQANYNATDFPASWADGIIPWAVYRIDGGYVTQNLLETTYEDLNTASRGQAISVNFGVRDEALYQNYSGSVSPICGTLKLPGTDVSKPGSAVIREAYYRMVIDMWNGINNINEYAEYYSYKALSIPLPAGGIPVDMGQKEIWMTYINGILDGPGGALQAAADAQANGPGWTAPDYLRNMGWGAAGMWYTTVAEQNGSLIAAVRNVPIPLQFPRVMEAIKRTKDGQDSSASPAERFKPAYAPATPPPIKKEYEQEIANALSQVYNAWYNISSSNNPNDDSVGNPFIDIINLVLGTQGLFEICRNTDIHPLAQLSAVGKSMIDSAISAFGLSAATTLFSFQPMLSGTASSVSSFFATMATIGLLVGFVLFYVLPFMPFIYFFFGVGSWIKCIFEAMVAMPLWALAHLRIDGEGAMGEPALKGYYLIFEIFIRPIAMLFGLIASVVVFAAIVKVLHQVFYIILVNTSGSNITFRSQCFQNLDVIGQLVSTQDRIDQSAKGPIDEFFFTILYTIIVYMIGTSCFKLIDEIPDNLLRWINAEVASLGDSDDDAGKGLMKYVSLGGSQFGSSLGEGMKGVGDGAKQTIQSLLKPSS